MTQKQSQTSHSNFMYDPDSGRVGARAVVWDPVLEVHRDGPATGPVAPDADVTRQHMGQTYVLAKRRAQLYLKHRVIFAIMGHRHQRTLKFRDRNPNNWRWDNLKPRDRGAAGLIYEREGMYQAHMMLDSKLAYIGRYGTRSLARAFQRQCEIEWETHRKELEGLTFVPKPSEIIAELKRRIHLRTQAEKEPT